MSDLISRQEVLNTLDFADNALTDEERTVENYKELLTECIKVLPSAENDGDLISRQAVENITWEEPSYSDPLNVLTEVREKVRALPSVENKEELTNEKAIAFLQDNGWLVEHDRIMTSGMENKGEWIPVSERLPLLRGLYKISDDVLITNGYEIDMGYLVERKGKIFWHYYGSEYEVGIKDEDNDATAWMPLPEPYKAERGE